MFLANQLLTTWLPLVPLILYQFLKGELPWIVRALGVPIYPGQYHLNTHLDANRTRVYLTTTLPFAFVSNIYFDKILLFFYQIRMYTSRRPKKVKNVLHQKVVVVWMENIEDKDKFPVRKLITNSENLSLVIFLQPLENKLLVVRCRRDKNDIIYFNIILKIFIKTRQFKALFSRWTVFDASFLVNNIQIESAGFWVKAD